MSRETFLTSSQKALLALVLLLFASAVLTYPSRLHIFFEALMIPPAFRLLASFWRGYVAYAALTVVASLFLVYFTDEGRAFYPGLDMAYLLFGVAIVGGIIISRI